MKKIVLSVCIAAVMLTGAVAGYKSVAFDITLISDGNGTLTCETQQARFLETVSVYVSPSHDGKYYVLDKLTVNGVDMTDSLVFNKLTLDFVFEDKTIEATFKEGNPPAIASSAAVFV